MNASHVHVANTENQLAYPLNQNLHIQNRIIGGWKQTFISHSHCMRFNTQSMMLFQFLQMARRWLNIKVDDKIGNVFTFENSYQNRVHSVAAHPPATTRRMMMISLQLKWKLSQTKKKCMIYRYIHAIDTEREWGGQGDREREREKSLITWNAGIISRRQILWYICKKHMCAVCDWNMQIEEFNGAQLRKTLKHRRSKFAKIVSDAQLIIGSAIIQICFKWPL